MQNCRRRWFWGHWITQFIISGPFVLGGIGLGMNLTGKLQTGGHFVDPHKKAGLALLILYLVQLAVGAIIHFVKTPRLMGGRRPPQNYFHAILGIAIITLAFWQVHYGIVTEWSEATTEIPPPSALRAWKAWIVVRFIRLFIGRIYELMSIFVQVIFVLYFGGLALLPRQYRQERLVREGAMPEKVGMRDVEGGSGEGLTRP